MLVAIPDIIRNIISMAWHVVLRVRQIFSTFSPRLTRTVFRCLSACLHLFTLHGIAGYIDIDRLGFLHRRRFIIPIILFDYRMILSIHYIVSPIRPLGGTVGIPGFAQDSPFPIISYGSCSGVGVCLHVCWLLVGHT